MAALSFASTPAARCLSNDPLRLSVSGCQITFYSFALRFNSSDLCRLGADIIIQTGNYILWPSAALTRYCTMLPQRCSCMSSLRTEYLRLTNPSRLSLSFTLDFSLVLGFRSGALNSLWRSDSEERGSWDRGSD